MLYFLTCLIRMLLDEIVKKKRERESDLERTKIEREREYGEIKKKKK